MLRVSIDDRHRREGIGRALVSNLVERARRGGFKRIVVSTDNPWVEAIAMYEAAGFDVTGTDDTDTHLAMNL